MRLPVRTMTQGVLDRMREAMWLLPLVLALLAGGGAWFLANFETTGALPGITEDPQTARTLLSTAATTTITFAGLVFSITLLALQLTSSQFSPRVLRQFLRAREGQLALGVFAGTFVFEMIVLARISERALFVPALSVTIGVGLAMLSLATFVGFVHHMSQSIRVVNIIEGAAAETRRLADAMDRSDGGRSASELLAPLAIRGVVTRPGPGAVFQELATHSLEEIGRERCSVLRMVVHPGDYVPDGAVVLEEWAPAGAEREPLDWSDVHEQFVFGVERTMTSDLTFGYRQLVDIAEKALSPGINDPTTAVQSIDRLHDLLRTELGRPPLRSIRVNDEGHGIIGGTVDFGDLVDLAFDEIRRYGADDLQVVRRLRAVYVDLHDVAPPERRPIFERKLDQLDRTAAAHFDDRDDRRRAGVADGKGIGGDRD